MLRVQYEALTVILLAAFMLAIFAGAEYKVSDFIIEFIIIVGSFTIFISLWLWIKLVEFLLNNTKGERRTKGRAPETREGEIPDMGD